MQNQNSLIYRWLKMFSLWPRWLQALTLFAFMLFIAIGSSLVADPSKSASDPFSNPTTLAFGVFLKLGVVVALIYLAFLFLRRWRGGSWKPAPRRLNVVETVHLSPRRALHLVQVGGQTLLIGATDQSVSLISPVDLAPAEQPVAVQPTSAPAASFAELLSYASQPASIMGDQ